VLPGLRDDGAEREPRLRSKICQVPAQDQARGVPASRAACNPCGESIFYSPGWKHGERLKIATEIER